MRRHLVSIKKGALHTQLMPEKCVAFLEAATSEVPVKVLSFVLISFFKTWKALAVICSQLKQFRKESL